MTRQRFVTPDVTRLELSEGDWIEVKVELNYAEVSELRRAAVGPIEMARANGGGTFNAEIDPFRLARKRMELYLIDWSFRDGDDRPVPLTPAALDLLDQATADEINDAIVAHEEAVAAKKTTAGEKR